MVLLVPTILSSPPDNSIKKTHYLQCTIQPPSEPSTPTNVHAEENNDHQAEFTIPFGIPLQENAESFHAIIGNSNVHNFNQPQDSEYRWIKDHPLTQVRGNPSKPVQTRRQLATDPEMIEANAEELHHNERLKSWERHVEKPFGKNGRGMDVKTAKFLMVIEEEVYVAQPDRFVDPDHPDKVYRLRKALYGLKQAPRAWFDELSKFLISKGFTKGLQIHQSPHGIFINQAKYTLEILKKYGMEKGQSIGTPMATKPKLDANLSGEPVDQTDYRSKIRPLMYLTSSRPDIVQADLSILKRYHSHGTLVSEGTGFELTAFLDADHASCVDTHKSTSGGTQFLGDKLDCTAMSSAEAEYVALSASCAQVMWMRTQLQDYGFNYNKIPLYCDSQSAIAISCNPVQHSRTKHIHTRYHFIKEQVENALPEERFQYLVRQIGMRCLTPAELEVLTNESA
ncbi:retrovirus-related pol polyprotein from transposon TNT 1-94 [Tanacetum coccineum]